MATTRNTSTVDVLAVTDPLRQLRDREPVPDCDRVQSYEREITLALRSAFDPHASERIGPIEQNHLGTDRSRDLHRERGGPCIGVVARSHVLQIDHDRIQAPQPLRFRAQGFGVVSVERVDGHLGRVAGRHADHVLCGARKPMLGTEERGNVSVYPRPREARFFFWISLIR